MRLDTLAILGLAGCVSLNPVTMVRLATLNPMAADPDAIAVQLTLPDGVGVAEGTAAMTISANFAETEEGLVARFELESLPNGVWRVAPDDQDALRVLQMRVTAAEEADPEATSGSFSVGFEPCALGQGPGEDARFSIAIQLDVGGDFLPLVNRARVAELFDAEEVAGLSPCTTRDF